MKPSLTSTHLSIGAALVFAAWIIWLWVDDAKKVDVLKPEKNVVKEVAQDEAQSQPQPSAFILPAPPQPAPSPVVQEAPPKVEPARNLVEVVKAEPQPQPQPQPKPEPEPEPVIEKAPEAKPEQVKKEVVRVQAEIKSEVKPEPKAEPEPDVHRVSQAEKVGGRALLRVLEHGKGPQIEIAWPKGSAARNQLYQKFQSCFSMVNALMDGDGNLFRNEEARGVRWEINMDRFSGFLRQADGELPAIERRIMRSISQRHKNLSSPVPVRIFPRAVDASLLGGLQSVVGAGYMNAKSIHARYVLEGSSVLVGDIYVDGQAVSGKVELSKTRHCGGAA